MGESVQCAYRAIVIDDMEFCRDLLTEFLEARGYQVISFPDVTACPLFPSRNAECIKTAACADFLLTDNRMPHMQGLDFLELMIQGKCKINPCAKAIFSALWTQEELDRAKQLNCKAFSKPYDLDMLSNWLNEQEKQIHQDRNLAEFENVMEQNNSDGTKSIR